MDGDVRLQPGQRRATPRSTTGCSPRCCATSGASTAVVMSDWGAVHDRVAAVAAGLDLEMPPHSAGATGAGRGGALGRARRGGARRRRVGRVLALVDRVGAARDRTPRRSTPTPTTRWPGRRRRECAVLLKNDGGCCRCGRRAGQRVAVVGEFARTPRYQGAGQLPGQPDPGRRAPRRAARRRCPTAWTSTSPPATSARRRGRRAADRRLVAEAVALAGGADVVVAFLGLPEAEESEGFDRTDIDLPPDQTAPARAARRGPTRGWWSCCPTARWCGTSDVGAARRARCSSAGWAGRRPAARSPTCCSARPTRRAGWPRPSRCGWPTPRRTSTSPARRARALRRGRLRRLPRLRRRRTGRSPTRSGTGCPTRVRLRRPAVGRVAAAPTRATWPST